MHQLIVQQQLLQQQQLGLPSASQAQARPLAPAAMQPLLLPQHQQLPASQAQAQPLGLAAMQPLFLPQHQQLPASQAQAQPLAPQPLLDLQRQQSLGLFVGTEGLRGAQQRALQPLEYAQGGAQHAGVLQPPIVANTTTSSRPVKRAKGKRLLESKRFSN